MKDNIDMMYIIPPACDPSIPLLGPYQMAGYAKSIDYNIEINDFNNKFLQYIINNKIILNNNSYNDLDILEQKSYINFLNSFSNINSYDDLKNRLTKCDNSLEYWSLIDYTRCCYDLFSIQMNDLRFRLDGVDSKYKWNIWSDIDKFICEIENSIIYNKLKEWILSLNIKEHQIIGVNITFESQLFFAVLVCKLIKELYKNNKILVGGGFVNSFISSGDSVGPIGKYCDIVNSGEGEAIIYFLKENNNCIEKLYNISQPSDGIAYYIPASKICNKILEVYPPLISKDKLKMYFSPKNILPLRFTYECYWGKCKFCTDKEYHSCLNKDYNVDKMINFCIEKAKTNDYDCIYFLDSAIPYKLLKLFSEKIIENNIKIRWGTNARLDTFFNNEEFIKKLSDSGCVFIKFGLESASQYVLNLMDKGTKIEIAREIIKLCKKYKILVHTYIMFAFPGETDEDRKKTMDFILDEEYHPDNYNCSEFIMYRNSIIAKELNYKLEDIDNKEPGWYSTSYSFTNDNIKKEIRNMRMKFDEKYNPADILISTGHTIALANYIKNNSRKIKLYDTTMLKLSDCVVIDETNNIIGRWRRRDGIIYIKGNLASFLMKIKEDTNINEFFNFGLNTNSIYKLINEGFLEIFNYENGIKLDYTGDDIIDFNYGNKFNKLKWYGYYDNN